MIVCMQVDRFSVTMEPDLGAAVRDAAERAGMSVSGWLAQAAADRLRNDLLGAALDAWEAEAGPFGDDESRRRGRHAWHRPWVAGYRRVSLVLDAGALLAIDRRSTQPLSLCSCLVMST